MANLYIATSSVFGIEEEHLFFVYENDAGERFILRAGTEVKGHVNGEPLIGSGTYGNLKIEIGLPNNLSIDKLDPGTETDHDLTPLALGGRDATTVWNEMRNFALSLPGQFVVDQPIDGQNVTRYVTNMDYAPLDGPNCNAFAASVLNAVGLNIVDQMPREGGTGERLIANSEFSFSGTQLIFGGNGGEIITDYANGIAAMIKAGNGNDTIIASTNAEHTALGNNIYNGGEGLDTVDYSVLNFGINVSTNSTNITVTKTGSISEDALVSIEHIVGTNHNDTFTIGGNGSGSLQINGGAGNDVYTVTGNGAEGSAIWLRAGMGESTIQLLGTGGGDEQHWTDLDFSAPGAGLMLSTNLWVTGAGLRPAGVELFTHEGHVTLDLSQVAGDTTIGEVEVIDGSHVATGGTTNGYTGHGYFADGTQIGFAAVSEVILGGGEDAIVVAANDNNVQYRRVA